MGLCRRLTRVALIGSKFGRGGVAARLAFGCRGLDRGRMTPVPEFGILGPLIVRQDGAEIRVPGARRRALLVRLLVSANEAVPAEALVEDVWESEPPPGAAKTLQSHVSYLRRALGGDCIQNRDGCYALQVADSELDSSLFESEWHRAREALSAREVAQAAAILESGLARWRGHAMADVSAAAWALPAITRLEEMRLTALEAWFETLLAMGKHHEVAAYAEAAVAEHPLHERIWAQLILALYRSGRQADALRSYQRLRSVLVDELGIEPSPELVALDEAVVLQRSELDWNDEDHIGSVARTTDKALPSGTVTLLFTDIVGSTQLWETQTEAMQGALARHDQILEQAIDAFGGYVFKTAGDQFCAAFFTALDGVRAAEMAQRTLAVEPWGGEVQIQVRMGLHTGVCEERGGDYFGPVVNRTARIQATAHGGQIVLSAVTADLIRDDLPPRVALQDLGEHRLKDLSRPERVFQLNMQGLRDDFPPLRSLADPYFTHNLPEQLSSFVGRSTELAHIHTVLGASRLVSLTGPGGSGKTRLALQAARRLVEQKRGGVWLVELAPVLDPESVPLEVAKVMQVREAPNRPITDGLVSALHDRELLLILDNCEHVIGRVADLTETLLASCPGVEILATSREALGIAGESVIRITPMSTPPSSTDDPVEVAQFESVSLFVERAVTHEPSFRLDPVTAPYVASICRRLDGMPLAIELAAARLRSLSVSDVENRLENRFRLLVGGSRTALARQKTLLAAVDWSYELLTELERAVLSRLSVFIGGWDLARAEAVCSTDHIDSWAVADLLGSLVDKSLVQTEPTADSSIRYRLLETIRAYAADRLNEEESQAASTRKAHANAFLDLAEAAAPHLTGPDQSNWLARLELEHENLRAALTYYLTSPFGQDDALRLAVSLRSFWIIRGYYPEGIEFLESALELEQGKDSGELRAAALIACGTLRQSKGDTIPARARLEEALEIARRLGSAFLIGDALCELAWLEFGQGDVDLALRLAGEAVKAADRAGDLNLVGFAISIRGSLSFPRDQLEARSDFEEAISCFRQMQNSERLASTLCRLAIHELESGDREGASVHLATVLDIASELHNDGLFPHVYAALGLCAMLDADHLLARERFHECMNHARRVDDGRVIAYAAFGLAFCATATGDSDAAKLHGAADALLELYGERLELAETALREEDHANLRRILGDVGFTSAYDSGKRLPPRDAVEFACRH